MVSDDVRLTVVPGSQQILVHAMEEGLVQIIIRAGAHVGVPSCRYMRNAIETAARAGEHCIATGFCAAGEPDEILTAWTSIASPALATVAAVMGSVRTPLDLARNKPRMATGLIQ
jgi:homoaconitase/3-isopropylmalate dehydratase large subunit